MHGIDLYDITNLADLVNALVHKVECHLIFHSTRLFFSLFVQSSTKKILKAEVALQNSAKQNSKRTGYSQALMSRKHNENSN
jgi:hypothetical protein